MTVAMESVELGKYTASMESTALSADTLTIEWGPFLSLLPFIGVTTLLSMLEDDLKRGGGETEVALLEELLVVIGRGVLVCVIGGVCERVVGVTGVLGERRMSSEPIPSIVEAARKEA